MYDFVSNLWVNVGFIVVIVGYNFVLKVFMDDMVIEI